MEKSLFVDEVLFLMQGKIDDKTAEYLRNVLYSKLKDVNITEKIQLPSIDLYTNEIMIKRFVLEMIAGEKEKTTIYQYVRAIRKFFDDCGKSWNEITSEDITTHLAIRSVRDKISANYKDTLLTYIGLFFTWAYEKDYIKTDLMKKIVRVKRTKKKIDRLTDDEVAIVKGIRKNSLYNALFTLMIETGLRVSEIRDLKITDFDWKNHEIHVWAEKTNEVRTVIITPDLEYAIKEYIANRESGSVFISSKGTKLSKNTIEKMARLIGEDADCHCKTTVHLFRKTYASILYRKTHDILLVSKLLGHKDTAVTIRYYLKDDIEDIKYRRLQIS